jgi:hypothetical protein
VVTPPPCPIFKVKKLIRAGCLPKHFRIGYTPPLMVLGLFSALTLSEVTNLRQLNNQIIPAVSNSNPRTTLKRSFTLSGKLVSENALLQLWDTEKDSLLNARRTRKEDKRVALMGKDVLSTAGILQLVKDAVKKRTLRERNV